MFLEKTVKPEDVVTFLKFEILRMRKQKSPKM